MRSPKRVSRAAFLAAVVGALVVTFAPFGQECSVTSETVGERCVGTNLFQTEGTWILVVVSVPVLLTLLPVLVRHRAVRIVSVVLLWTAVVVAMLSVGVFFLPAAILATIAASLRDPAPALGG